MVARWVDNVTDQVSRLGERYKFKEYASKKKLIRVNITSTEKYTRPCTSRCLAYPPCQEQVPETTCPRFTKKGHEKSERPFHNTAKNEGDIIVQNLAIRTDPCYLFIGIGQSKTLQILRLSATAHRHSLSCPYIQCGISRLVFYIEILNMYTAYCLPNLLVK